jgi:two-component system, NarL family, capsular synthesis sensor histidine kinase RcsC
VKDDSERADSAEKPKTAFDESARLKSAFLRNVNHAIRTPLNTIIGHAELLIEATEPSDRGREIRSSAEAIAEASSQLERNFRAILDLSKLHAGSFTLAPARIKLTELIELQLFEIQPAAERKATAITCEIQDPEITITVDEYCLRHALANLLDNAVKFTERGRVMVRVYREPDGNICVNVEDTGVGIDPSYVPSLFEPFSQEDSSQARRYQGMGLGLALAKRYLALNGAELSMTSTKHAGSVFTIRFAESTTPRQVRPQGDCRRPPRHNRRCSQGSK